ncbi:PPOX class F420-dependent oxidoreductase [Nakamurella antarctica]|uniref:PPOX class F420-dependent oxidoreductase n=1 Tax=Nakamurella antarctica TaxID=1902245 RepID=A0A3G8ZMZ3_9ACTN|nr:PPOX class F420-dependent oxidoreductase [Nakamurella antarctica]AZI58165.1 PPOX class F420-dependent oxidoreductase [Nakamurella antarctica]
MTAPLDVLAKAPYMLLVTFRKDGTPVPTPVWTVRIGTELWVWTSPTAGKVKRIRRDAHVQVSPCTRTGGQIGDLVDATARIGGDAETSLVLGALVEKYGFQARITQLPNLVNRLLRKPPRPAGTLAISMP